MENNEITYESIFNQDKREAIKSAIKQHKMTTRNNYGHDLNEITRLQLLVRIQKEYIEFLNEANKAPVSIAAAHGWVCPKEDIDRGVQLREYIKQLENI